MGGAQIIQNFTCCGHSKHWSQTFPNQQPNRDDTRPGAVLLQYYSVLSSYYLYYKFRYCIIATNIHSHPETTRPFSLAPYMTSIFVVQDATWNHCHRCLPPWGWTLRWPDFGGAFGQLHEGTVGQEKNTKAMEMVLMLKMMLANTIFFGKLEAMATNSVGQTKSGTFPFSRRTSQTLFLKGRFFVKRRMKNGIFAADQAGGAFCSSGRRLEKPATRPTCRGKRFPDLGGNLRFAKGFAKWSFFLR